MASCLYLLATPIGNLEDITLRCLRILREVDMIAAEDTRQTAKLLNHYEIKKPMISYHEHNKKSKGDEIIDLILEGKTVALVSDAGMPCISDPGEDLVRLCVERGIEVIAIPGPSASLTALSISGLSTSRFVFEGFLPVKGKERSERLQRLSREERTIILYEAPHRLLFTLKDLREHLGNPKLSISRELTKKFEETVRTDLDGAIEEFKNRSIKGEFVLIIEGKSHEELKAEEGRFWDDMSVLEHIQAYMERGMSKKEAIALVAKERNLSKREVYNIAIEI
ncbi:16S rRNA (cytidine(1402)-2'-O)-methyltransferase [Lutispora saccharofermentans]|uniref:Ribosomal RNA small subunit methyltransferase I n=1 Tax=Lutispora saccharofermentans TaxID=3024236 RepID=A0ABT1NNY6_9FIRM|nr:16S rRNA (cytidine(1402)-2'-O)-methyltransferase [Lutispora saccharofermentans]MCQ1531813.1 16S rRNA (cytidine(1402)-2'-O)-methyltransferase [Lutispora saccharofermentans]